MSIKKLVYTIDNKLFNINDKIFTFLEARPPAPTLWLRADAGVITDINDKVEEWTDQSGNGYNALQGSEPSRPILVPSGLNGKPVLQFDGAQFMQITFGQTFAQPFTFFTVWESTSSVQSVLLSNQTNLMLDNLTGSSISMFLGARLTYSKPIPWGNHILTTSEYNTGASKLYENGTLITQGNVGNDNLTELFIGRRGVGDRFFNGQLAEIIFYDDILSEGSRQSVEQYLLNKYAL